MMDFPRKSTQEKELFLHVSNFMMGENETITKTAQKKNTNQKRHHIAQQCK
jgi:hypothetical protein